MTYFLALHGLVVVIFTGRILLRDDLVPVSRLAWFIVLSALPYVGSALYFLFGEIDLGHRANKRHDEIFDEISKVGPTYLGHPETVEREIDPLYRPAFRYTSSINGFQTVPGNRAELLADSDATQARLIADIDAATDHVHVLYYIWLDDGFGTNVAQALMRAARRGVTCRAMADGLGSRGFIRSDLWKQMAEAGVKLGVALPLRNLLMTIMTSRIDLRNHRKITVIDGRITYCGSRNSADPEFRVKPRFAPWVDIMLRFEGPVVAQNQLLFASDWVGAVDEPLSDLPLIHVPPFDSGFPAQVVGDGPTERSGSASQMFTSVFACARDSITLTTPYFVPDAMVLEALQAAALRGVRVTLIFPKKNDSWVVAAASRSTYRRLLEAGCSIHEYRDGLLHAKTLTVDDSVTLIGSSNIDLRSFDLNYENNILLQDTQITQAVQARQETYLAQSDQVHLAEVRAWSPQRRIWNNVIATIGPIL